MSVTREMLLNELKELQRLTAFEQALATVRRTQAATATVSQELGANARRAGERLALLGQAVRRVGGSPDLVGPVLGRLGALVQTQVNQVQTLQGALLGDLALEHRLRERARYARTLAVTLGETGVLPVLDRLELAHSETIAWLERRLADAGRTGSTSVRATPVQVVVGSVRQALGLPFGCAAAGLNRAVGLVTQVGQQAPAAVAAVSVRAGEALDTVADKAEQAAERVDTAAGPGATASAQLDAGTGPDVGRRPPFAGYERLPGDRIVRHVADTDDVDELRALLAFEQAHKARKGVLTATRARLGQQAQE